MAGLYPVILVGPFLWMACTDGVQDVKVSDDDNAEPTIMATRIRLETQFGENTASISGNRLESDEQFSRIEVTGNVQISLPGFGTVDCNRLTLSSSMQGLNCEGDVRGRFLLPQPEPNHGASSGQRFGRLDEHQKRINK